MTHDVVLRKLDQIRQLHAELRELLRMPFEQFESNTVSVRAAERTFQLIVELASDINTQILLHRNKKTPDTYKESFVALAREGILPSELAERLVRSAQIRNILAHEYDFDEDRKKFYVSTTDLLPEYERYIERILTSIRSDTAAQ